MISSVVTQVCSQISSAVAAVPFLGSTLTSVVGQVCSIILSALQGYGL